MKTSDGILVVSFGTTYQDSRRKTIEALEREVAQDYPGMACYRAWTSGRIRSLVAQREGLAVDSVGQALERMASDGITRVVVQPTHVIPGIEYEKMCREVEEHRKLFLELRIGETLLHTQEDCRKAAELVRREHSYLTDQEVLVWMGHGTNHEGNRRYGNLQEAFEEQGCSNIWVATVEGKPDFEQLLEWLEKTGKSQVHLAPFLLVAGEHVQWDMAGDQPDSWKRQLENRGCQVQCHMMGLGEYDGIRKMYREHLRKTMED